MKNIKKYILVLALIIAPFASKSQTIATYIDSAGWGAFSNASWTVSAYDVTLTQPGITAAMLGNSNSIPNLAGIMGKARVSAATLSIPFTTLLSSNIVDAPYILYARTIASPVGNTNVYVSGWTNISVTWLSLPGPPTNLRIVVPLP